MKWFPCTRVVREISNRKGIDRRHKNWKNDYDDDNEDVDDDDADFVLLLKRKFAKVKNVDFVEI